MDGVLLFDPGHRFGLPILILIAMQIWDAVVSIVTMQATTRQQPEQLALSQRARILLVSAATVTTRTMHGHRTHPKIFFYGPKKVIL